MSAMASSVSAPVVVPQATKRTHAEMSASEPPAPQNPPVSSSITQAPGGDEKAPVESKSSDNAAPKLPGPEAMQVNDQLTVNNTVNETITSTELTPATVTQKNIEPHTQLSAPVCDAAKSSKTEIPNSDTSAAESKSLTSEIKVSPPSGASVDKSSCVDAVKKDEVNKAAAVVPLSPSNNTVAPSQPAPSTVPTVASSPEPKKTTVQPAPELSKPNKTGNSPVSQFTPVASNVGTEANSKSSISKPQLEDGEEPEKKAKLAPVATSSKVGGKTPEQILEYMDKTFDQRRKIITKQMPTIPELKELYPDLFMGKQLLIEFQRITKIDIDQKVQEFCVRYATAVIEMACNKKGAAPVLARWEQAKQENDTLRQYWDMVTALCLLPLHFGENFVEMVLEIGEDEEVVAQGKIVPTLVARGNIFRTDEFFLIAENTIVQEFEEFTIAFASLYSSYWVFNMVYPETIENTYNYIQRCIVRQREPGSIPTVCKNFTKALQKWNKGKDGK